MVTRNDFIEKLSKWLTADTCEAIADYVERIKEPIYNCESNYEGMLIIMGEYTEDPEGLREYIELMLGTDAADGDRIEDMAADMVFEW